jgi:hypothetical protein
MNSSMTGRVVLVQEGRFQMIDDAGVGHLFILGHRAAPEPAQLAPLQHRQARIRVAYRAAPGMIGNVATRITVLD